MALGEPKIVLRGFLLAGVLVACSVNASYAGVPTSQAGAALSSPAVGVALKAPPTVAVGRGPTMVAVDAGTRTAYVATRGGVSVVDISQCTAQRSSGCGQSVATFAIGQNDLGILVDEVTRSVYVSSARLNLVATFSTEHCNAADLSGCGHGVHTVPVGRHPTFMAIDALSRTLYVSNSAGIELGEAPPSRTVSMIDMNRCNGNIGRGCGISPPTVRVGRVPSGVAVDPVSRTVYVPDFLDNDVSLLDAKSCNARVQTGCMHRLTTDVGEYPDDALIDPLSHTVYVSNSPFPDILNSVSMVDISTCNIRVSSGCSRTWPTTPTGSLTFSLLADPATRTVFAVNEEDSSVSIVDERRCNATDTSGCRKVPSSMTGDINSGGAGVDPLTHTVYLSSQDENTLTVLDGSTCNGHETAGCTPKARTTASGVGPAGMALQHSTATVYVTNQVAGTVSVINDSVCSARRLSGCKRSWPTISVGSFPKAIGLDTGNHTAYVSNYEGNSVSVFDTSTCNAQHGEGCGQETQEIAVPGGAYTLLVDPATHTVYVAEVDDGTISIIDGSICNATDHSGCDQNPVTVDAGDSSGLALDATTGTLYVADRTKGVVGLVNTATCNGADTTDCTLVATTAVGVTPRFMAVDSATQTLYVSNKDSDTLSMVDTSTCSARQPTGCSRVPASVAVGHLPYGVVVNPRSDRVYVGLVGDSTMQSFDGTGCNAHETSGCAEIRVAGTGGWPTNGVVDPAAGTVYVDNNVDANVSIVPLSGRL